MANLTKLKDDFLDEEGTLLNTKLDVSLMLISKLVRPTERVITSDQAESLKSITDPVERRDKLIGILRRGSVENFKKFCKVLEDSQPHLLEGLLPCFRSDPQAEGEPPQAVGPISQPKSGPSYKSMNASSELQLWNYDKFKLISSLKVLDQHLIGNIPAILNKIKFRPSFWQHLKNNQVMHEDTIDEIKYLGTSARMCEKLFNDIKTVGTLRGLLMTLADDGQEFIIVNLGFEPNDFQQQPAQTRGPLSQPKPGPVSQREFPACEAGETPSEKLKDEVDAGGRVQAAPFQATPFRAGDSGAPASSLRSSMSVGTSAEESFYTRDDIVVAVLDSGVRTDHPDFEGAIVESHNFSQKGEMDPTVDSEGHGTFVAGIIHQYADFVKILNLKFDTSEELKAALIWITDWENRTGRKVHIINMSFTIKGNDELDKLLSDMSREKVIVCAASNDGQLRSTTIGYPAKHGLLLCIGSCDRLGNRVGHSAVGRELNFLFPGQNVTSYNSTWRLGNVYARKNGTSFAAPHCAAIIARILAMISDNTQRRKMTNCRKMRDFLETLCGRGYNINYGYGLPDLKRVTAKEIQRYVEDHFPPMTDYVS